MEVTCKASKLTVWAADKNGLSDAGNAAAHGFWRSQFRTKSGTASSSWIRTTRLHFDKLRPPAVVFPVGVIMSAEQPDRLSTAFEALNAARKESRDEKARNLQTSRDRKSHFDKISTEIIMPTLKNIAEVLKCNDCDVMVPEKSNGFQFQIGENLPNMLPWQFMIEFNPDDDFVQLKHSDPQSKKREMSVTDKGVALSEITAEWVRTEAENFIIEVIDLYTCAVQESKD
jgi:hypothetical protein